LGELLRRGGGGGRGNIQSGSGEKEFKYIKKRQRFGSVAKNIRNISQNLRGELGQGQKGEAGSKRKKKIRVSTRYKKDKISPGRPALIKKKRLANLA